VEGCSRQVSGLFPYSNAKLCHCCGLLVLKRANREQHQLINMVLRRYMTEDEACQGLSGVQRGYAQVAWRFLDVNGFINYGVAPAMQREKPEAKHPFTVVVVGAGMAGQPLVFWSSLQFDRRVFPWQSSS